MTASSSVSLLLDRLAVLLSNNSSTFGVSSRRCPLTFALTGVSGSVSVLSFCRFSDARASAESAWELEYAESFALDRLFDGSRVRDLRCSSPSPRRFSRGDS